MINGIALERLVCQQHTIYKETQAEKPVESSEPLRKSIKHGTSRTCQLLL